VEPLSEIRDGAPSTDSALEASETDGDESGASLDGRDPYEAEDIERGRVSAGRA